MLTLMHNEYFSIEERGGKVYMQVHQIGMTPLAFSAYLAELPRVKLTKFNEMKKALEEVQQEWLEIGEYRSLVEINIAKDNMMVKARVNALQDEVDGADEWFRQALVDALKQTGIVEGIDVTVLAEPIIVQKEFIVATGIPPENGEDAQIVYFQLSERKPALRQDGTANFFDMNFIDIVDKGDWLGEKIPASEGKPGRNVFGEEVPQMYGKDKTLMYDAEKVVTATDVYGKTVLYAADNGVVQFINGKITIGQHLLIEGDVGVETGNIEFNGAVTVIGTVLPNYSVKAESDISIMSELGISGATLIESARGDIFIKGGIFGNGVTKVMAKKNVFVKHANECIIEAGRNIQIGYYTLGSHLKAKNVYTDMTKGKIIGGEIEAEGQVYSAYIGSQQELKTRVHVKGFDRHALKVELDQLAKQYKEVVQQLVTVRREIEVFEQYIEQLNTKQHAQFARVRKQYDELMEYVHYYDTKRQSLIELLETKGEGEVNIIHSAFPETFLEIKSLRKRLAVTTRGTFYAIGHELFYD